jgi:hypothetical protein
MLCQTPACGHKVENDISSPIAMGTGDTRTADADRVEKLDPGLCTGSPIIAKFVGSDEAIDGPINEHDPILRHGQHGRLCGGIPGWTVSAQEQVHQPRRWKLSRHATVWEN